MGGREPASFRLDQEAVILPAFCASEGVTVVIVTIVGTETQALRLSQAGIPQSQGPLYRGDVVLLLGTADRNGEAAVEAAHGRRGDATTISTPISPLQNRQPATAPQCRHI
ncbi:hypothetical protein QBC46DRAFT_348243 [Diplogelasinospora grovesii]|uniref:Uncharacterized protein n=1 Tax=Diplogelasinospora grovesii TaxID=303347 RepID=A0AAN6MWH3_9PEZI|nr:hypothetical protein QBC46DRAFT_348243 [Diplogelasinospora grovesii]